MYVPEKFKETRPEVLQPIMRAHPLATLVVTTESGIVANHIPVMTLAEPEPLEQIARMAYCARKFSLEAVSPRR